MPTQETVLDRASALVEQFRDCNYDFPAMQLAMHEALTGPFADEIFGEKLSSLQSNVEGMQPEDHAAVNIAIHNFSGALLLKHQELLRAAGAAA